MLNTPAPASVPYYTPSDPADLAFITQAIAERVTALHTLLDTPPRAKASRSSALATANSSWLTVPWTVEDWDTDNMVDVGAAPSRVTCKTAGRYDVRASVSWYPNSSGVRIVAIARNGQSVVNPDSRVPPASGGWGTSHQLADEITLNVGDYLEIRVFQTSGGNLNLDTSSLSARRIGS